MQIKWRVLALNDLLEIVSYIAEDNPVAAYDVNDEIYRQVELLVTHPNIGRRGRTKGTKELVISNLPYVLPYRIIGEEIEIIRVYHTSRQWPKNLQALNNK
ncbi:MAG: type II toxin-antitoxin system mRNA interferase toxin, RelE/StbE family [Methylotenera sp.]|nr:MAG: type II toxin-antitoxin system mRNA interferase toxin, RelE/StbE family [Methylotenera sp.]